MQIAQALNIGEEAVNQALPGAPDKFNPDIPGQGFGEVLGTILSGVLVIAALMVLLYLLWGGIEWITSGGDKAKTEKARNRMTQAVIGIIVLAASTAIFMIVQSFLGVSILDFGDPKEITPRASASPKPGGLGPRPSGNKTVE